MLIAADARRIGRSSDRRKRSRGKRKAGFKAGGVEKAASSAPWLRKNAEESRFSSGPVTKLREQFEYLTTISDPLLESSKQAWLLNSELQKGSLFDSH